jgi:hypothetical protein
MGKRSIVKCSIDEGSIDKQSFSELLGMVVEVVAVDWCSISMGCFP